MRRGLVKRAEEWKGSSVREYAQAALALLVTCHSSLVTEEAWMQTNQRAAAACLPQAGLEIDPAWRDCPSIPQSGTPL